MYQHYDPVADLLATLTDPATALPLLNWIELYKGQLEDPESFNAPALPAVYIDLAAIEWESLRGGNQIGHGLIKLYTLIRLPAQTHQSDPRRPDNTAALGLVNQVHETIAAMSGVHGRVQSLQRWVGAVFVSEQHYRCQFDYSFGAYIQPDPTPSPRITVTVPHPTS